MAFLFRPFALNGHGHLVGYEVKDFFIPLSIHAAFSIGLYGQNPKDSVIAGAQGDTQPIYRQGTEGFNLTVLYHFCENFRIYQKGLTSVDNVLGYTQCTFSSAGIGRKLIYIVRKRHRIGWFMVQGNIQVFCIN